MRSANYSENIALTCSPGSRSRSATTASEDGEEFPVFGKTTIAFGEQEWLIRAAQGDTQTPMGDNDEVVSVKELVVNYLNK